MYTHVLSMYAESTLAVCSGSKRILAHSYLGIVSDFLSGRSRQHRRSLVIGNCTQMRSIPTTTDLICT